MTESESKLIEIIKELKQCDDFDESEPLIDSGILDSFDLMNLIEKIDDHFKVSIDGVDLTPENFTSVQTIASLIERLQG